MKKWLGLKAIVVAVILLLLLILNSALCYWLWGDITNRDVQSTVVDESHIIQNHVDVKVKALEDRLVRIEDKLDLLLKRTEVHLPDNMTFAK